MASCHSFRAALLNAREITFSKATYLLALHFPAFLYYSFLSQVKSSLLVRGSIQYEALAKSNDGLRPIIYSFNCEGVKRLRLLIDLDKETKHGRRAFGRSWHKSNIRMGARRTDNTASWGIMLIPTLGKDPNDPLNWSKGRKYLMLACVSLCNGKCAGDSMILANQQP